MTMRMCYIICSIISNVTEVPNKMYYKTFISRSNDDNQILLDSSRSSLLLYNEIYTLYYPTS